MTPFAVNPTRADLYKNFKFRVSWDGHVVAGISEISALRRVTDVVAHREGGDPSAQHKSPGLTAYDPIVLRRGVTHDTAFEAWANLAAPLGSQMSLANFRKTITIDLLNEAGVPGAPVHCASLLAVGVCRDWPARRQPRRRRDRDARTPERGLGARHRRGGAAGEIAAAHFPRIVGRPAGRPGAADRLPLLSCPGLTRASIEQRHDGSPGQARR